MIEIEGWKTNLTQLLHIYGYQSMARVSFFFSDHISRHQNVIVLSLFMSKKKKKKISSILSPSHCILSYSYLSIVAVQVWFLWPSFRSTAVSLFSIITFYSKKKKKDNITYLDINFQTKARHHQPTPDQNAWIHFE